MGVEIWMDMGWAVNMGRGRDSGRFVWVYRSGYV